MACSNSCNNEVTQKPGCGSNYVFILVLYILLAIVLGCLI